MILVAPTAFKGTHTASEVAAAAARGASAFHHLGICTLPVSDGGPGLGDALASAGWQQSAPLSVTGPLGTAVQANLFLHDASAAIESAQACGLALVPAAERSPWRTTTFGVGELVRIAAPAHEHIFVGLGGSATVDAGLGMAAALGWRLLDANSQPVTRTGRAVLELAHVERDGIRLPRVTVLADVANPLTGANGAARVFAPQKGATADDVARLEAGLERVAEILRRDVGVDVASMAGGGAAGGLGAGLVAFAGATIMAGSRWVLDRLDFECRLRDAQLVITGEGGFDAQSGMGKVTGEVIARAGARGVPVLLIAGRIESDLPPHVHAVGNRAALTLADIEALVRNALPRLLAH